MLVGAGETRIDSTRIGFRDGLMDLAAERGDIAFISTDSVKVVKAECFAERYPERYFELGIAEQNGVAFAAGLATTGIVPYIATYAGFLTMRACEQMRTFVAYPQLKVRFVGANGGLAGGNREGVTHQFFEDLGILRAIPGFTILVPADGAQVRQAIRASVDVDGPVYIRIGSGAENKFFADSARFELGKARIVARYGDDVALFGNGTVMRRVMDAAESLKGRNIQATVVEVATLKPIDTAAIAGLLRGCGAAVTVEDHNIIGGLGSAVAEVIAETAPALLARIGLADRYPESGHVDPLLDAYGLSVAEIARRAEEVFREKNR